MLDRSRVLVRIGLVLAAGALAVAAGSRGSHGQDAIEMGLDMETTGNTASALGPIEACYEVQWSGTPFDGVVDWTIDVYVKGDTRAPLAYDAWVNYNNQLVHVLQTAPTDPLVKMPGAEDLSTYYQARAAFGAVYPNPPQGGISGDGTLVRVGLDFGASGDAAFAFAKGEYVSYPGSLHHPVTTSSGRLRINGTCGPVGGIAELPDVVSSSGSSGRPLVILATAAAAGAMVLGAGAMYAWRRRSR